MQKRQNELQQCRAQLVEQKALADGYKDASESIVQECQVNLAAQKALADKYKKELEHAQECQKKQAEQHAKNSMH